jgi:mycothiol synthase
LIPTVLAAVDDVIAADNVSPLNEASLLAIRHGLPMRLFEFDGIRCVVATGLVVELFVHPESRRQGYATAMLSSLIAKGETQFWAHGDLHAAQALAARLGLESSRTLLILQQPAASLRRSVQQLPDDVAIRTFRPADTDALVQLNARAFAEHREQGQMDRADFERRCSEDWFDPAGLFVAERNGHLVGFHWTKLVGSVGEVYVVAVEPDVSGAGLGTALTACGLDHLVARGADTLELYVESANTAARRVYAKLGFTEHARDTLYTVPGTFK